MTNDPQRAARLEYATLAAARVRRTLAAAERARMRELEDPSTDAYWLRYGGRSHDRR